MFVSDFFAGLGVLEEQRSRMGVGRMAVERRNLLSLLEGVALNQAEDKLLCEGAPDKTFSVSWFKNRLDANLQSTAGKVTIWNKWVPRKHNIFWWRLRRGRIPSKDNLIKMGISIPDPSCLGCGFTQESVAHIFFHCSFAQNLWDSFCTWWKVPIHSADSIEALENWVHKLQLQGRIKKCFMASMVAVYQVIWDRRNGAIFKGENYSLEASIRRYKELSLFWISSRSTKVAIDTGGWYGHPNFSFL